MRTPVPPQPAHPDDRPRSGGRTPPPTLLAVEAVLLWPHGEGGSLNATGKRDPWPIFAIVLDERVATIEPSAHQLFDLLDRLSHRDRISVVSSRCQWSTLDARRALLKLSVHANAPVRFDVDILLPARPVLDVLHLLSRGATLAITTQHRARDLTDRVDIHDALRSLVLLSPPSAADLTAVIAPEPGAIHRTLTDAWPDQGDDYP